MENEIMTHKERLEAAFMEAKELGKCVYVDVKFPGGNGAERIINPPENIDVKLDYYKEAYDDNLFLKTNMGIEIVSFGYIHKFED